MDLKTWWSRKSTSATRTPTFLPSRWRRYWSWEGRLRTHTPCSWGMTRMYQVCKLILYQPYCYLELVRLTVLPPAMWIFVVLESGSELCINFIGAKFNCNPWLPLVGFLTCLAVTQKSFHTCMEHKLSKYINEMIIGHM